MTDKNAPFGDESEEKKPSPEDLTILVKALREHEACSIARYVRVRRVHGGLIYTEDWNHQAITSQFVPVDESYFDTK